MVIYRKYRPASFADVIGQDLAVKLLAHALKNNSLPHALLFTGSRGTGKTTTARLVAKALNCEKFLENGDVCNQCEACLEINQGIAMNIVEIDAASNRGIEEIRQLKEAINYAPLKGSKKVYIIDEVHMLTKEAFNALLKTLEEPPEHAVFILATTEQHKVPTTILSRVQRYTFKLANEQELATRLNNIALAEGVTVDSDAHKLIYQYSGGSYRDAESILGKALQTEQKELNADAINSTLGLLEQSTIVEIARLFISGNLEDTLLTFTKSLDGGVDAGLLMRQLLSYLRTEVVSNQGKSSLALLKHLLKWQNELKYIDDTRMILEIAVVDWFQNRGEQPERPTPTAPSTNPSNPIAKVLGSRPKPDQGEPLATGKRLQLKFKQTAQSKPEANSMVATVAATAEPSTNANLVEQMI